MSIRCNGVEVRADVIVDIAKEAGKIIMDIYNTDLDKWEIVAKQDNSPLTRADLAANSYICRLLSEKYPSIPIVSEENKNDAFAIRRDYSYFFCVDPLDGTKEFIKRNGQFTVNIGLCERSTPVLGVVHVPASNPPKTFYGTRGHGSFTEDNIERYPVQIHCVEFSESDRNLTIVSSASHGSAETDEFISRYTSPTSSSLGSSLKLLLVAEGKAHVYPRLGLTSEWDTCASHAIVTEAGGEVLILTKGDDGKYQPAGPVVYNKENVLNPYFIVFGRRRRRQQASSAQSSSSASKTIEPVVEAKTSSSKSLAAPKSSSSMLVIGLFVAIIVILLNYIKVN